MRGSASNGPFGMTSSTSPCKGIKSSSGGGERGGGGGRVRSREVVRSAVLSQDAQPGGSGWGGTRVFAPLRSEPRTRIRGGRGSSRRRNGQSSSLQSGMRTGSLAPANWRTSASRSSDRLPVGRPMPEPTVEEDALAVGHLGLHELRVGRQVAGEVEERFRRCIVAPDPLGGARLLHRCPRAVRSANQLERRVARGVLEADRRRRRTLPSAPTTRCPSARDARPQAFAERPRLPRAGHRRRAGLQRDRGWRVGSRCRGGSARAPLALCPTPPARAGLGARGSRRGVGIRPGRAARRVPDSRRVRTSRANRQPRRACSSSYAAAMRSASSREIACSPRAGSHRDGAAERRVRDQLDDRRPAPARARRGSAADRSPRRERARPMRSCRAPGRAVCARSACTTRSSRSGIGSPWGSWVGNPSSCVDPGFELLRERVLEQLRFRVHLVQSQPETIDEVALEQTMVAKHLERATPARLGEPDAAIRHSLHEAELVEALRHRGRGRRAHAHPSRERRRRHAFARRFERVDRLQVVLDGDAEIGVWAGISGVLGYTPSRN